MANLQEFINPRQLKFIRRCTKGEEGQFFTDTLDSLSNIIDNMASIGETDGKGENKGDDAKVVLHYFNGSQDWWITEKDSVEGEPQHQAFGLSDIGFGLSGLGYISIQEIIGLNIEIDLHWQVITVKELRKQKGK